MIQIILVISLMGLATILTIIATVHWYKDTEFFGSKKFTILLFVAFACVIFGLCFLYL